MQLWLPLHAHEADDLLPDHSQCEVCLLAQAQGHGTLESHTGPARYPCFAPTPEQPLAFGAAIAPAKPPYLLRAPPVPPCH